MMQPQAGLTNMLATKRHEVFRCFLTATVRGNRKLEAYATE